MTKIWGLVISASPETVKDALAPFEHRFLNDGQSGDYLTFFDETDEYRARYETESTECLREEDGHLFGFYDERFRVKTTPDHFEHDRTGYESANVPNRDIHPTFEAYASHLGLEPDGTGRYGIWLNPNAKWDYWFIYAGDDDKENTPRQCQISGVDLAATLDDWGFAFYAVITSDGRWIEADNSMSDEEWHAACIAHLRAAPSDFWFTCVLCHC